MNDKITNRCNDLTALNMKFCGDSFVGKEQINRDFNVYIVEIQTMDDEQWLKLINKLKEEYNNRINNL